ncbi:MAG: XRE family transcriptional regulator [Candidatus Aminicenantes bacterium]|nr:XRE family transcriptional regulator [Candidatus Aminicenantes bacterium]
MSLLGDRLQQARKARGWSLATLAKAARGIVTRQALYKYEKGLDTPRSEVLLALAHALGIAIDYFFRPSSSLVTLSELACRKRSGLGKRDLAAIRAQVKDRIERWLELESFFPPKRFAQFLYSPENLLAIERLEDVENLAKDIRSRLSLGLAPIENLTELLEDSGIKIFQWPGEEGKFDGFSCWANNDIPVIVVKAKLSGDRQRSSLAHELGHLVMKPVKGLDPEKAARRFSGAFLVPDEVVRRELGEKRHKLELTELFTLKRKYGMSIQQWIYRAKDLGIITNGYAASLFRCFRTQDWHKCEPGEQLPDETSSRLKRLAIQAVAEDLVSPARAAELSGISLDKLREEVRYQNLV